MEKRSHPFTPEQLEEFKELLLARRRELLASELDELDESKTPDPVACRGSLSNVPTHLADLASDSFEQEMRMRLMEQRNAELIEIDAALDRLRDGTYGICEITGKPIELRRLRVIPWTRYSLEGQEILERENMPVASARHVWRDDVFEDEEGNSNSDTDTDSDSDTGQESESSTE